MNHLPTVLLAFHVGLWLTAAVVVSRHLQEHDTKPALITLLVVGIGGTICTIATGSLPPEVSRPPPESGFAFIAAIAVAALWLRRSSNASD